LASTLRAVANPGLRRTLLIILAASALGALGFFAADVPASTSGSFTYAGTVSHVVDGDTIDVRLASGVTVRVRVIGIDTPERGACYANAATARTSALARGKRVILRGDATQDTHDRYSRLLAYVMVRGSLDMGAQLLAGGYARVYIYAGRPFLRTAAYQRAEQAAIAAHRGQWVACPGSSSTTTPLVPTTAAPVTATVATPTTTPPATTTPRTGACDAAYPTVCIPPPPPDLDCKDVPYKGFKVLAPDPHRFDGDHDGLGCES
jgi:micrococcal nuclease